MNTAELKAQVKAEHLSTIAAISSQYGQATADAVEEIFMAIAGASAITALLFEANPIMALVSVDITAELSGQVCSLCERAFGLSEEQTKEALSLATELHRKHMNAVETSQSTLQ